MWLFGKRKVAKAYRLLDSAETAPDDYKYAEWICNAADIATALEKSSTELALSIWARIAELDGERARAHELVDHARTRLHQAGRSGPPTFAQELEQYYADLPPNQRFMAQARHAFRILNSDTDIDTKVQAATEGLKLTAEHEKQNSLTKKQAMMKRIFQKVLRENA